MKTGFIVFIIVGAIAFMTVLSQADHHSGGTASPVHVRTEFALTVRAPYNVSFPLFGPVGERSVGRRRLGSPVCLSKPRGRYPRNGFHDKAWPSSGDMGEHRIRR